MRNSKTTKLITAFTLTATTLMFSGCGFSSLLNDEDTTSHHSSSNSDDLYTSDYEDQQLMDDNGKKYTLHQNDSGSETARYEDGQEVTFKRDEHGNLDYISGSAGLLAGLAAGYFLFHGFNPPAGAWNSATNRYAVSEPLSGVSKTSRATKMQKYVPSNAKFNPNKIPRLPYQKQLNDEQRVTGAGGGYVGGSSSKSNVSKSSSGKSSSSSSKSVGSVKSGFGGAGARSASS